MLSLLVGNSVNQILSKIGMSICADVAQSAHVAFQISNDTNITCGALKGEIAISLAMTSGLLMVSLCFFNNTLECIHIFMYMQYVAFGILYGSCAYLFIMCVFVYVVLVTFANCVTTLSNV